jgi:pimeloyl-ACP methyl ester carboxylesterase
VLKRLGTYGLKEVAEGWTWKFDPGLFDYLEMGTDQHDKLMALPCKTALMLGEQSEDEGALYGDHMLAASGNTLPVVTVPGTYHHLMFDQPVAVAAAMKLLLLEWQRQNLSL